MLKKEYNISNGTISVDRNYIGKDYAKDMVKKCVLFWAQEDRALTRGSPDGIIKIGSDIPRGRRI